MLAAFTPPSDFLTQQKQYERVRIAIEEKQSTLDRTLAANGLETGNLNILIIAYKDEGELEIHAKKKTEVTYRKLASYRICARSGRLGPKRKEGDYQVPEILSHQHVQSIQQLLSVSGYQLSEPLRSTEKQSGTPWRKHFYPWIMRYDRMPSDDRRRH